MGVCSLCPRGFWELYFPQSAGPSSGLKCSLHLASADCSPMLSGEARCLNDVAAKSRSIQFLQQGLEEAASPVVLYSLGTRLIGELLWAALGCSVLLSPGDCALESGKASESPAPTKHITSFWLLGATRRSM